MSKSNLLIIFLLFITILCSFFLYLTVDTKEEVNHAKTKPLYSNDPEQNKMEDEEVGFLTDDEYEKYIENFISYDEWEFEKRSESIQEAIKKTKIDDSFIVYFMEYTDAKYFFPKEILLSWIEFFEKNAQSLKIKNMVIGYKVDLNNPLFQIRLNDRNYWFKTDLDFIKTMNNAKFLTDLNNLKELTIQYIKKHDTYHESILLERDTYDLASYVTEGFWEANKKNPKPFNFIDHLLFANETIDEKNILFILLHYNMVGLPSNLYGSWVQLGLKSTKNKKLITFFNTNAKINKENEKELGGIEALQFIKANPDLTNQFLNKNIISDKKELQLLTKDYLLLFKEQISPANAEALLIAANEYYDGTNGEVNEGYAQILAEKALSVALIIDNKETILEARNMLGVIFDMAYTKEIKNKKLAIIHIEDAFQGWINECEELIQNKEIDDLNYYAEDEEYIIKDWVDCANYTVNPVHLYSNIINYNYFYGSKTFEKVMDKIHQLYDQAYTEGHVTKILGPSPAFNKAGEVKDYDRQKFVLEFNKKYEITQRQSLLESKCMFQAENMDIFSIDEVIDCYDNLAKIYNDNPYGDGSLATADYNAINDMVTRYTLIRDGNISYDKLISIKDFYENIDSYYEDTKKEGRYALLIGNDDYKNNLNTPLNDVELIAKKLEEQSFKTYTFSNLNLNNFKDALLTFSKEAKNAELSVVYYSGHAYQIGGQNYLIPTDIDENITAEDAISLSIDLNKFLRQNIPGNKKIIFLDACRNNPFNSRELAPINVHGYGDNTLVSFATAAGKYAYDGSDDYSPYAQALAKIINKRKDIVLLLRDVRTDVRRLTNNNQTTSNYSNLIDDIILAN